MFQLPVLFRSHFQIDATTSHCDRMVDGLVCCQVQPGRGPGYELFHLVQAAQLTYTPNSRLQVRFQKLNTPAVTEHVRHIDLAGAGAAVTSTLPTWPHAEVNGQGTGGADFACYPLPGR